jgi:hypothetical protein
MRSRSTVLAVAGTVLVVAAGVSGRGAAPAPSLAQIAAASPGRHVSMVGSVSMAQIAAMPAQPGQAQAKHYSILPEHELHSGVDYALHPHVALGGGTAPPSSVVTTPVANAAGFNGINITEMEGAGTGQYAHTNGGLEPPDQAMCVGNGYVLEGVNQAWKVSNTQGVPLTAAVPITQFFNIPPAGQPGGSSFVSDPRCVYDAASGRFFALTLEADEASGITQIPFLRAHTYFAVSKTGDPTGDWWIYNVDITDDGLMGTPQHTSCPCIDDQPLMGLDAHGLYMSANEFSDAEIIPVAPPTGTGGIINGVFSTLPDFRNGQAQVYGLSKAMLINGVQAPLQAFDTGDATKYPLPAADQATRGAVWSSLQPAFSPPGDTSVAPTGGAEFFMSQLDFAAAGDNRIAVWALTNTSSLDTASPSLTLKNKVINTLNAADTYTAPIFGVNQKDGPRPLGDSCGCPEEQINANDDRMNQVMLTNGHLWSGVNTALPPIDAAATTSPDKDPRAGIMYFEVQPAIDPQGNVTASMVRDGYVNVPRQSVLFPSIAAAPSGAVGMFFTLAGVDYFPSAAWTRLDGLAPTDAPVVHVSGAGAAPEDGFTGYPLSNQLGLIPIDPTMSGTGVSRWGDYTAAAVDANGCLWGAAEYIPDGPRDPNAGNWGTFITRVMPTGCTEAAFLPPTALLKVDPCKPLFTDPAGDDQLNGLVVPVPGTQGMNPQLDIIAGDMKLSADGSTVTTILTISDLNNTLPPGGQGNEFYFYWSFGGIVYYTHAHVTGSAVTYEDGINTSSGRSPRSGAPTDTGSFNAGKNGTIVVNVPVSVVGNLHRNNLVQNINAESRELEGAIVLQYDAAGPGNDWIAGNVCTATASTSGNAGPTTGGAAPSTGTLALPNTVAASGSDAAPASAAALGFGALTVRAVRRRREGPSRS